MQNGFYSATGGMVTQLNRLNVISNNLANVNTTGFKRDDVIVGDFMRYVKESRDELPLRNNTKEAAQFLNRSIDRVPHVVEDYINQEAGAMQVTDNPLDFALKKENTFFLVETPQGVRLTRDGSFKLNDEGIITTKEGYPVLPNDYFSSKTYIRLEQEALLTSDNNANIYQDNINTSKLMIVHYQEPKELKKEGNNLYTYPKQDKLQIVDDGDLVESGVLEKANVNPVSEMVALIETNRLVEMYQKVMTSHMNDLNNDAINKLASLRA